MPTTRDQPVLWWGAYSSVGRTHLEKSASGKKRIRTWRAAEEGATKEEATKEEATKEEATKEEATKEGANPDEGHTRKAPGWGRRSVRS